MYADSSYYRLQYGGSIIQDSDLKNRLNRACDQIDNMTYNKIVRIGFENLTPFQQDKVKKAVCLHADFIDQYGAYVDMPISGYSAGSISISLNTQKINGVTTTQEVLNYLKQTGLTCRRL